MTTSGPLAYVNGRFLPQAEARLSVNDAGFVWGATVTDLCRTFRQRLFRLEDHLRRFRQSCDLAHVPQILAEHELAHAAEQLVAHNVSLLAPEDDLALVLLATPGPIGYYLGEPGGPGDRPPTLILHTFPLPLARYVRLFAEGARLVIPSIRHVPAASVDPRIKQRSRLFWWLAEQEAHETDPLAGPFAVSHWARRFAVSPRMTANRPAPNLPSLKQQTALDPLASALLLDETGHVTETAAANFLIVRKGTVVTPPRSRVLPGISLAMVEKLCQDLGIPFVEEPLGPADCYAADEALLTSTSFCLAGVSRIDGHSIPWPGPIWQRLLAVWSERVGVDIARQIFAHR